MLGASLLCILFFTSGCVSTLALVVPDPLWSSYNSYPSVRVAGDSLKHPDILTPLILLDLPFSAALDTVIAAKSRRPKIGQSVSAAPLTKEESAKFIEVAIRKRIKKPVGELTDVDLEKVKKLGLGQNKLTDVKGLKNLTQLTHLVLLRNRLTDVKGLENLSQLAELQLQDNQLTDVKGLEKLTNLKGLWLNHNRLTNVRGLEKLTQLKSLNLMDNRLTDVRGLEKLTQLKSLNLMGNRLTDVRGLEKLTQLKSLNLIGNRLTDVRGLEKLTQLETLFLLGTPDLTKAQIEQLQKALPNCDIDHNAK